MKYHSKIGAAILLVLLPIIGGCGISQPYVPNRPPVPIITHQGQLNLSGGVHFPDAGGYDFQAVYAPWEHYSLYGGFQYDRFRGGFGAGVGPPEPEHYDNRFFEFGAGYFDSIQWAHYEAFILAGLGYGADWNENYTYPSMYNSTSAYTDTTSLRVFRLGIQQSIAVGGESGFGGGVGLGLGVEHLFGLSRYATNYSFMRATTQGGDSVVSTTSFHETSAQTTLYAEPIIFLSNRLPVSSGGKDVFSLRWLFEVWWAYRSNPYPSFGSFNASFTASLQF